MDHQRLWQMQAAGGILEEQLSLIAERMAQVLRTPPMAGQNISEWAKQQACRKIALEAEVPGVEGLDAFLLAPDKAKAAIRDARTEGRIDDGIRAVSEVMSVSAAFWIATRDYAREMRLIRPEDERVLSLVISIPPKIPTDRQAERLMTLLTRCREVGFQDRITSTFESVG